MRLGGGVTGVLGEGVTSTLGGWRVFVVTFFFLCPLLVAFSLYFFSCFLFSFFFLLPPEIVAVVGYQKLCVRGALWVFVCFGREKCFSAGY